jgi:hypothetical protein
MLAASIHEHAGLGNQLWRYVCCRVFAENHGYEFGVSHPGWRGKFLNIDWGREVTKYESGYHMINNLILLITLMKMYV